MHSSRSDIEPIDPSLVPLFVSEIDSTMYGLVVMITLLVYDTIITMDKEIKYFWRSPCKFVSLIYFANRFVGILGVVSGIVVVALQANEALQRKGLGFTLIISLTNYMTVLLIDYILLMRVLALYHQDKRLAACLRTIFVLEAVLALGALICCMVYGEISVGKLAEGITVCLLNRSLRVWGTLIWAVPMVYAIILMVLALLKAAQYWRELAGFNQINLLVVLIKDQAIYFILVIFCSVMGIISYQPNIGDSLLANLLSLFVYPRLLSVLGSYLLIHLKEAGERGANGGTSYRMRTMSSIGFS